MNANPVFRLLCAIVSCMFIYTHAEEFGDKRIMADSLANETVRSYVNRVIGPSVPEVEYEKGRRIDLLIGDNVGAMPSAFKKEVDSAVSEQMGRLALFTLDGVGVFNVSFNGHEINLSRLISILESSLPLKVRLDAEGAHIAICRQFVVRRMELHSTWVMGVSKGRILDKYYGYVSSGSEILIMYEDRDLNSLYVFINRDSEGQFKSLYDDEIKVNRTNQPKHGEAEPRGSGR